MVYLSEILNLPVFDSKGQSQGRLEDLQVSPASNIVQQVRVRQAGTDRNFPWASVETFSPDARKIVLGRGAQATPAVTLEGEAVHLKRDVLDRQIIDIQGRKVVRVNDVLLAFTDDRLQVRAVEVGLAGAIRRLVAGILSPNLVRRLAGGLSERSIPWDYVGLVEPSSAQIRLKVHQQLARMHPADLADILEDLGRMERKTLVSSLDTETAAQALSEVEPQVQAAVVEDMHVERAADLLEEMQPDEAADILGDLSEDQSNALLAAMDEADADDVRELLSFGEKTAGGLMNTEFFRANPEWTVAETLTALRHVDPDLMGEMDEIPLVDANDKLEGMVPLVRLVRRAPEEAVTAAMRRDARAVRPTARLDEVVARFEKYHLRGLAVTDEFGTLIGLITIEDILSHLTERT